MIQRIYSSENELSIQIYPPPVDLHRNNVVHAFHDCLKLNNRFIFSDGLGNQCRTFFRNGSCAYLDRLSHGPYVELALPECSSVYDVVACDRAAMGVLEEAAELLQKRLQNVKSIWPDSVVLVYKNNVALPEPTPDSKGEIETTYGTHENYSVNSHELWESTMANSEHMKQIIGYYGPSCDPTQYMTYMGMLLVPFLASRQIICGAGSLPNNQEQYEISQRSRFLFEDIGKMTVEKRALVNTKNETHSIGYHRLHLICGDANMSEFSNFLKFGSTGIFVRMLEENYIPNFFMLLPNSIDVLHKISKDLTCKQLYDVINNGEAKQMSAVDIQQCYLDLAQEFFQSHESTPEEEYVLHIWQFVLDGLKKAPESLFGLVDWVTKKALLDKYCNRTRLQFSHQHLHSLDLMYHALNKQLGMYYKLEAKHPEWKIIADEQVDKMRYNPPNTRALARMLIADAIAKQGRKEITCMDWDTLTEKDCGILTQVETVYPLPDPFDASIPRSLQ